MQTKKEKLEYYLNAFYSLGEKLNSQTPHTISLNYNKHKGHIIFACLIHGNETGTLPAILKCIKKLMNKEIHFGGKVSFLLGNIEAAKKGVRYLESDLNRCFGNNYVGKETQERKRALEIMPILKTADVFIDFHQTIMPSLKPFYIFEMNRESYFWARATGGATTLVTRKKGAQFSSAGMCSDEYVRSFQKVGLTLELGEQGFSHEAESLAFEVMKRALKYMDQIYLNNFSIEKLCKKNNDFEFLSITYREPFESPKKRLNEGFCNFHKISKNMVVGSDQLQNPLESPKEGYILFPKYPLRNQDGEAELPLPGEIYVLATPTTEHPLNWQQI
ncbi:succinylglutamate desuccinylase/aspartoacylase domain-containing protein [Fluviispira multicolorata]|uniref:succinylglutamate desuccinylase/aspartoacylase domain-containing protein n=1 Tax=Fluviispira multicolorata TaxID=2654512 RepID=UPI001375FA07|nr:succinylglutamate desuccinylase/aspartoacylase family protein [Fluviispira multicolorata]